mgnify:CR=1 FL=1
MGRRKQTCTMLRTIFSRGCPFFSYMASRKKGSMSRIMQIAAVLTPVWALSRKNSGKPRANAAAKKMSCRLVRLNATFVFTFVKSLGTGTYAKKKPPFVSVH